MSRTLSTVDPKETFFGLESLIIDADAMNEALYAVLDDVFSVPAKNGIYKVPEEIAARIFFLAGMTNAMIGKVREAYYVAHENEKNGGKK